MSPADYHREMQRRRMAEKRRGVVHSMPAARVKRHVERLVSAGATPAAIARAARVSPHTVARVLAGHSQRPHAATGAAILAVTLSDVLAASTGLERIPATGTKRRIRALMAIGWPHGELTVRVGHRTSDILRGVLVRREFADAVTRVYDDLWDQPGPSMETRRRALKLGYPVPLAYDDDTIDDPASRPHRGRPQGDRPRIDEVDPAAVERAIATGGNVLTVAERELVVARLAKQEWSDRAIATHLGITPETAMRIRHRLNIESRWTA